MTIFRQWTWISRCGRGNIFGCGICKAGTRWGFCLLSRQRRGALYEPGQLHRRVLCGNAGGDAEHGGLVAEGEPGLSAADDSASAGGSARGHGGGLRQDGGLLLLRVDIAAAYETEQALCEILGLCIDGMFALFPSYDRMWVKAIPQAVQRVAALKRCGFAGGFFFEGERGRWGDYYEIERPYRGMGYCGLVCAYCAERLGCAGVQERRLPGKENCRPYRCGVTKGYSACGDCPGLPVHGCILDKMRIRTFAALRARSRGGRRCSGTSSAMPSGASATTETA